VRIGLTGGIGSGKTTVANIFRELGVFIIDADAIARAVTQPGGEAIDLIAQAFGITFIDAHSGLNRSAMRAHVFKHPDAKQILEGIIHPLVRQSITQTMLLDSYKDRSVLLDIPLLVESADWRYQVDWVIVVDCTEKTQIQRVEARNSLPPDEIKRIIASQASRCLRLQAADIVICNEGIGMQQLNEQVHQIASRFGL
jgi:dephospho-CoA kinase